MEIAFSILGEPKGKGRPRFTRQGHTYTPQETKDYEKKVAEAYKQAAGDIFFTEGTPIKIEIRAFFKEPKKKLFDLPMKTPDTDNIAKIILDGLNNIAYTDDKQVVDLIITKRYTPTDTPSVEVTITDSVTEEEH